MPHVGRVDDRRRLSDTDLSAEMRELVRLHNRRDTKVGARRGLVLRNDDVSNEDAGTVVPPPFDDSKLIIQAATGLLTRIAGHTTGVLTSNQPIVTVNRIESGRREVSKRADATAHDQELLFNGILWHQDQANPVDDALAWSAVVEGVGWLLVYPYEMGFGLPDRQYWEADELSDDELIELLASGDVHRFELENPNGERQIPERWDSWRGRRHEAMHARALNADSLFVMEPLTAGVVYVREDRGSNHPIKACAIIEEIPTLEVRPGTELAFQFATEGFGIEDPEQAKKWGLYLDQKGNVAGGLENIGVKEQKDANQAFTFIRYWTRDEMYVAIGTRGSAQGDLLTVWYTPHSFGRVPIFEQAWKKIPGARPEDRYEPSLEAAYSMVPGFNQALTMASNLMTFNDIPRWILKSQDGKPLVDPSNPSQPRIFFTDEAAGLNPEEMEILAGGGELVQLTIEDGGITLAMVQFYMQHLNDMLPAPSARGQGDETGPAWTTRLEQQAAGIENEKPLANRRRMWNQVTRFMATELRKLDVPVAQLSAPGRRGSAKSRQSLIELNPDDISLNMTVRISTNTAEEAIALQAAGLNYFGAGVIDEFDLHEIYFEDDDPDEAVMRMDMRRVVGHIMGTEPAPPESVIAIVADLVLGRVEQRLAEANVPNAQRVLGMRNAGLADTPAELPPGEGPGGMLGGQDVVEGEITGTAASEAVGVRRPGQGMSLTQPRPAGAGRQSPRPGGV